MHRSGFIFGKPLDIPTKGGGGIEKSEAQGARYNLKKVLNKGGKFEKQPDL